LHFFGGKVNFSRIVRPRLATIAFFGEKVQFLKFGLATIAFFWGKSSISEVQKLSPNKVQIRFK
jgi:hypothetical protein